MPQLRRLISVMLVFIRKIALKNTKKKRSYRFLCLSVRMFVWFVMYWYLLYIHNICYIQFFRRRDDRIMLLIIRQHQNNKIFKLDSIWIFLLGIIRNVSVPGLFIVHVQNTLLELSAFSKVMDMHMSISQYALLL